MGALPKHKRGKGSKGRRRSHLALRSQNLVPCPKCHEMRLPHQVCQSCGTYKGMEVVEIKTD